ncbi:hypothetical protein BDN67DRAFT_1006911 [Paxillus ammoniavirescens]|nr:hypothetical protein BDN67DRAFT_1006911 [Paxillus ammoniavirescens]
MSRHRLVRNINVQDELDDDALSEEGEDMTDEQHAQMESGYEHIRAILGDEAVSGLDEGFIKDTLWQFYFDIEKSVSWLYDEQERRAAARERKVLLLLPFPSIMLLPPALNSAGGDAFATKETTNRKVHIAVIPTSHLLHRNNDGVPLSPEGQPSHFGSPHYPVGPAGYYSEDLERPRVPLIVLAQQGQPQTDYYPAPQFVEYGQEMDPNDISLGLMSPDRNSRLSTITELTERTEPSRHWPSRQQLVAMNNPRALSSTGTTSSYGQVIDRRSTAPPNDNYPYPPVDPNEIPPSPSPSAVKRLSSYDSAPSLRTPTESEVQSESAKSPPRAPSVSVPPTENIPDIPDLMSKSSRKPPPPPEKDVPPRVKPPKRSKLAELASSRASTISSSRSSDLESTSVLTYPGLRPSSKSRLSLASRATNAKSPPSEISEKSLPSVKTTRTPSVKSDYIHSEKSLPSIKPPSTTTSSMSSHVRKAIQTAMELEAHDQEMIAEQHAETVSETSSVSTVKPPKPLSPTSPTRSAATADLSIVRNESDSKARPQSKLAKLAQAKSSAQAVIPRTTIPPSSPPKELPRSHTEYLTPIANGATATTAITTSYQSLHSLSTVQALEPVPLVQMPGAESRPSKLALKVKKAQDKHSSHSSATDDEGTLPAPPSLFLPKSIRSRASPSAFASLLLSDPLTSIKDKDNKTPRYGREELNLVDMYQASLSQSKSTLGLEVHQQQRHSCAETSTSPDLSVRSASFAFDVPSPDDIVFNARRGTALAQRR